MAAIIDKIDYLGTVYDIADSDARADLLTKATVPDGGTDGQVMIKDGAGFTWGDPTDNSIVKFGSFSAGATSCAISISLPSTDDYIFKAYSVNPLTVTSYSSTSTQVTVNFNKQTNAGELCLVARKVN